MLISTRTQKQTQIQLSLLKVSFLIAISATQARFFNQTFLMSQVKYYPRMLNLL